MTDSMRYWLTCVLPPSSGAPFDTAVSYRPGARFGPRAIRAASARQTAARGYNARANLNPKEWVVLEGMGVDWDNLTYTLPNSGYHHRLWRHPYHTIRQCTSCTADERSVSRTWHIRRYPRQTETVV